MIRSREIRRIAARELRYYAENYETMPGRPRLREAYRLRRQANRFETRL